MKSQLVYLVFIVLVAAAVAAEPTRYTCVMHPEVVTDQPGTCPKCGMTLVPVKPSAKPKTLNAQRPTPKTEKAAHSPGHDQHEHHDMTMQSTMQSSVSLSDPMSREGSGTSWLPDSSPMYARMFMHGDDMLMLHGAAFPRYVNAGTRRGDDRIDAPNWVMAMDSHPFCDVTQFG